MRLRRGGRGCASSSSSAARSALVVLLALAALWWRLSSGPIELDIATPWLTAAIKENFGDGHEVEIGGTQLERDAHGRTSLRIRDIVVRDAEGTIVASAPKAEVGISGPGLFTGRIRAERLSLVGAEMAVRIEPDSKVTVFAGGNKRPFVTASASRRPPPTSAAGEVRTCRVDRHGRTGRSPVVPGPSSVPRRRSRLAALLAWIESLDASGLDGRDLTEIGLKGGNLTVDDQRNGKQWTFTNIDLSVTRPKGGGIALTLGSEGVERPWLMRAAMTPGQQGRRIIDIETHKVSAKDLMLAMRLGEGQYEPDLPLSARIRADIGPDGIPRMLDGRILVDKGVIIDLDDPLAPHSDRSRRDQPRLGRGAPGAGHAVPGGVRRQSHHPARAVRRAARRRQRLGPARCPAAPSCWPPRRDRSELRSSSTASCCDLRIDPEQAAHRHRAGRARQHGARRRAHRQPRFFRRRSAAGARHCRHAHVGCGDEAALAGLRRAEGARLGRRSCPGRHGRAAGHLDQRAMVHAQVERPADSRRRPVDPDRRPRRRDPAGRRLARQSATPTSTCAISGRTATINVGRGNVEISPGRKLSITNGVFEVPDTFPKAPPAKARFRLDGSVPAAAELLGMERLREYSGTPLDPATSRGTLTAQVTLGLPLKEDLAPGSSTYTINMDVANFAAERMVMGQKVEAALLKVSANNQGHWIRGDVKINGVPAALDYRKPRDGDADVRVQATLDENARNKFGFDLGGFLTGPVPVKLSGRVPAQEGDSRFAVEADLTQAKVDNLLPGWSRLPAAPRAQPSRWSTSRTGTRFEDLVIEAPGASVKGAVEVDCVRRCRVGQFPGLQPVRRRQGHAQGGSRLRRHAAGDRARRRL